MRSRTSARTGVPRRRHRALRRPPRASIRPDANHGITRPPPATDPDLKRPPGPAWRLAVSTRCSPVIGLEHGRTLAPRCRELHLALWVRKMAKLASRERGAACWPARGPSAAEPALARAQRPAFGWPSGRLEASTRWPGVLLVQVWPEARRCEPREDAAHGGTRRRAADAAATRGRGPSPRRSGNAGRPQPSGRYTPAKRNRPSAGPRHPPGGTLPHARARPDGSALGGRRRRPRRPVRGRPGVRRCVG